jgi:TRAP-type mannitol/chloroaromatic compound transport system permease small subunit
MKTRGWIGLIAGVFLVVFMAAVWIWVAMLAAHQGIAGEQSAQAFFGRTYLAFALVMVAGVLGIANGIWQIRLGRPNRVLVTTVLIVFLAALGTVFLNQNAQHP